MAVTLKGRKLYIAVTLAAGQIPIVKDVDIANAAAYAALNWTQVTGVGSIGQTGTSDNVVTYDEMDSDVLPKSKGISDAGTPQIEVSRKGTDKGQIALRAAGLTKNNYAFKILDDDSLGTNGTTTYLRGMVGGPTKPNGRQESFNLEVYTLALNQREIVVEAA